MLRLLRRSREDGAGRAGVGHPCEPPTLLRLVCRSTRRESIFFIARRSQLSDRSRHSRSGGLQKTAHYDREAAVLHALRSMGASNTFIQPRFTPRSFEDCFDFTSWTKQDVRVTHTRVPWRPLPKPDGLVPWFRPSSSSAFKFRPSPRGLPVAKGKEPDILLPPVGQPPTAWGTVRRPQQPGGRQPEVPSVAVAALGARVLHFTDYTHDEDDMDHVTFPENTVFLLRHAVRPTAP